MRHNYYLPLTVANQKVKWIDNGKDAFDDPMHDKLESIWHSSGRINATPIDIIWRFEIAYYFKTKSYELFDKTTLENYPNLKLQEAKNLAVKIWRIESREDWIDSKQYENNKEQSEVAVAPV